MIRRLGVFWSASGLLASALVALATSAAQADSFEDWATVSVGGYHACGVRKNGKLYCWGNDQSGQVGNGTTTGNVWAPQRVGTFEDWAQVSAGQFHTCGVRKNGKLYCWGSDGLGQVGDGSDDSPDESPHRIGTFEDWANVSAGSSHTCGVRKNGKLYCWGTDQDGQVGDGGGAGVNPVTAPKRIGTFEDWSSATAGNAHSCGIRHGGKLYCWGEDHYGQAGDGDGDSSPVVAPVRVGSFEDWATVSAGFYHTCGVRKNGKLYCWGNDGAGQVGDGVIAEPAFFPRRIGTFEDWVGASSGVQHSCGLRANGKTYCWGNDASGQVGDGDVANDHTAPSRVGSFEDWSRGSASGSTSCGIRHGGKLYCWGWDVYGQVGNGGADDSPVKAPVQI